MVNSSIDGDKIIVKSNINIGMATALSKWEFNRPSN